MGSTDGILRWVDKSGMEENLPAKIDRAEIYHCTDTCASCCRRQETTERLVKIQGENTMRDRAQTFSMQVSGVLILAYLVAAFMGKPLILPDVIWQLIYISIASPWVGPSGGKIIETISGRIEAQKQS